MRISLTTLALLIAINIAQGIIGIDPFIETQPKVEIGDTANNTYHNYGSTIIGEYRVIFIRNFAPVDPISFSLSVTNGELTYTTYTGYDYNNYLFLDYYRDISGLQLDLEKYKSTGAVEITLDQPSPNYSLQSHIINHNNIWYSKWMSSFGNTDKITIPISEFETPGGESASGADFTLVKNFRFEIHQTQASPAERTLKIKSISIIQRLPKITSLCYSNDTFSFTVSNLSTVSTNRILKSASLNTSNWQVVSAFISGTETTNWSDYGISSNSFYKIEYDEP